MCQLIKFNWLNSGKTHCTSSIDLTSFSNVSRNLHLLFTYHEQKTQISKQSIDQLKMNVRRKQSEAMIQLNQMNVRRNKENEN